MSKSGASVPLSVFLKRKFTIMSNDKVFTREESDVWARAYAAYVGQGAWDEDQQDAFHAANRAVKYYREAVSRLGHDSTWGGSPIASGSSCDTTRAM